MDERKLESHEGIKKPWREDAGSGSDGEERRSTLIVQRQTFRPIPSCSINLSVVKLHLASFAIENGEY